MVSNSHQSKRVDVEDEDEDVDEESPTNAITIYIEVIKLGNDMITFFQSRGEEKLVDSMFTIIQKVQNDKLKLLQQASLLDYTTV